MPSYRALHRHHATHCSSATTLPNTHGLRVIIFPTQAIGFGHYWKRVGCNSVKVPHLDDVLVNQHGFGFCDVIEVPGNNANDISRAEFLANKGAFLHRVEKYAISMNGSLKRLCFVGKRQWKHLFTPILSRCPHGRLNQDIRPEGWPLTLSEVEVWIMPSPSGRAVIPHKERLATYIDLAGILADEGL